MGLRELSQKPKELVDKDSIAGGEVDINHLSPGLLRELSLVKQHGHEGGAGRQLTSNGIILGTDLISRAVFDYQDASSGAITDSLNKSGVSIEFGWNQVTGAAAASVTQTVTFPRAFSSILFVIASFIGAKNNSAATSIGDTSGLARAIADATAVTITGFTAVIKNGDNTNLTATMRYAYSWIAIGVK